MPFVLAASLPPVAIPTISIASVCWRDRNAPSVDSNMTPRPSRCRSALNVDGTVSQVLLLQTPITIIATICAMIWSILLLHSAAAAAAVLHLPMPPLTVPTTPIHVQIKQPTAATITMSIVVMITVQNPHHHHHHHHHHRRVVVWVATALVWRTPRKTYG